MEISTVTCGNVILVSSELYITRTSMPPLVSAVHIENIFPVHRNTPIKTIDYIVTYGLGESINDTDYIENIRPGYVVEFNTPLGYSRRVLVLKPNENFPDYIPCCFVGDFDVFPEDTEVEDLGTIIEFESTLSIKNTYICSLCGSTSAIFSPKEKTITCWVCNASFKQI
jgi:hypothetical protein